MESTAKMGNKNFEKVVIGNKYFGNTLIGPNRCENLHQISMEYFDRREDSEKGLHVYAQLGKQLLVDDKMTGNPSQRREGIKIRFSCECCNGEIHTLNIVQHKGMTLMFWSAK